MPSASSSRYWFTTLDDPSLAAVTLTFGSDVAAFGFFGIDVGDFGGNLSIELYDATGALLVSRSLGTGGLPGDSDGSVLYAGTVAENTAELFRSVRFISSGGTASDTVAFDNLVVADACQARLVTCDDGGPGGTNVPEPATIVLLSAGLFGLGALRLCNRLKA